MRRRGRGGDAALEPMPGGRESKPGIHRRSAVLGWLLALSSARAAADGLPDYPRESDILVDTPGTTSSVAGGLFNPAAWSIQPAGGFLFAWNDAAGDLSDDDFTGVLSFQHLAFGVRHFQLEPTPGDELHVRDYTLGVGGGNRAAAWGVGYAWGGGDLDQAPRHERLVLGSVVRHRTASFGLAWTDDLEVDDNFLQADLGIRPFGPRITLFGDAVYGHGDSFDDIRSGYGLEVRPLPGLALAAKARSTGDVSFRIDVALERHGSWSFRPHLDDDGKRSAATYSVEITPPRPCLGDAHAGRRRAFPALDLRGPVAYQRYEILDRRRTLLGTLRGIAAAAQDPRIGGVVVNLSGAEIGPEMLWEIRAQLAGLRARGKKVIVYVDRATMSGYMLATVADQIWMDPQGMLDLRGLATGRTYMRHALDKLGVGMDEWRFFTYKSAFEVYSRDSMSDPDREQRQQLLDDFYAEMSAAITAGRGLTRARWDSLVNGMSVLLPADARAAGLVDSIGSFADAQKAAARVPPRPRPDAAAAALAGVDGDRLWSPLEWGDPPRIAVLYAIGPCDMETGIRGRRLSEEIRKARRDRRVRAVVLRADSPGGDALPSDLVAREIFETAKKKPVIVSQGQVAASGGYWISMFADTIVAAPLTITGSIGVIGGWAWNKGFGDKIGFDYDGVKHGTHADLGLGIRLPLIGEALPERPLTREERDYVEKVIRISYRDFVDKVAKGRGLDAARVDSIGQGRVWSGVRGRNNGLVDELGGLWRSVQIAKAAAGLPPGRKIALVEGPPLGRFDWSALQPRVPPWIRAAWTGQDPAATGEEPLASGEGSAADPAPVPAASRAATVPAGFDPPLTAAEIDFLRRIVRARGRPLYMMEPIEIWDGAPPP
jgi:protease IV